jgi:hypothetical protein
LTQTRQGISTLRHRDDLIEVRDKLRALAECVPPQLSEPVGTRVSEHINSFTSLLQQQPLHLQTFQPTKQKQLAELKAFDCIELLRSEIVEHIKLCDLSIDNLAQLQSEILYGKRKNALADWWLSTVTDHIDIFLSNAYVSRQPPLVTAAACADSLLAIIRDTRHSGYRMDAIPSNYIDEAPNNIRDVRANLEVIQKILKSFNARDDIWKVCTHARTHACSESSAIQWSGSSHQP